MSLIKKCSALLLLSVCMLSLNSAHAGLLLEPGIGYRVGTLKLEPVGGGADQGGATSGVVVNGRLAYTTIIGLWLGADVAVLSGGKMKSTPSSDLSGTDIYAEVGYAFPLFLRAWLGYGISDTLKGSSNGTDSTFSGGTHVKMGVGFNLIPFVSLNAEYYTADFGKYESGSTSGSTSDIWSSHKDTGIIVGVSVPFNL